MLAMNVDFNLNLKEVRYFFLIILPKLCRAWFVLHLPLLPQSGFFFFPLQIPHSLSRNLGQPWQQICTMRKGRNIRKVEITITTNHSLSDKLDLHFIHLSASVGVFLNKKCSSLMFSAAANIFLSDKTPLSSCPVHGPNKSNPKMNLLWLSPGSFYCLLPSAGFFPLSHWIEAADFHCGSLPWGSLTRFTKLFHLHWHGQGLSSRWPVWVKILKPKNSQECCNYASSTLLYAVPIHWVWCLDIATMPIFLASWVKIRKTCHIFPHHLGESSVCPWSPHSSETFFSFMMCMDVREGEKKRWTSYRKLGNLDSKQTFQCKTAGGKYSLQLQIHHTWNHR